MSTARRAAASGIAASAGDDQIINASAGQITADAAASSLEVSATATVSVTITPTAAMAAAESSPPPEVPPQDDPEPAIDVESATSSSASLVRADAIGIDGGDGNDVIRNAGTITSLSNAHATDVASANVNIPAHPIGLLKPTLAIVVDSSASVESLAAGIEGGAGSDTIVNRGTITPTADAAVISVSANLNTQITIPVPFFAPLDPFADATSDTTATAFGIHGEQRGEGVADERGVEVIQPA